MCLALSANFCSTWQSPFLGWHHLPVCMTESGALLSEVDIMMTGLIKLLLAMMIVCDPEIGLEEK